jgi:endonuclease/exonuclease/phosphatase family metal-dependent hydrolase
VTAELRLITYNIRKGKGANPRPKSSTREIGAALGKLDADVLLCQEVFHSERDTISQSDDLAGALSLTSYYGPNKYRTVGHHGNTTFTRLDVVQFENHDISTNDVERRGALYLKLRFSGGVIHVFNVHLGLNKRQRVNQVQKLERLIGERCLDGDSVVLAGDFNDWNGRLDRLIVGKLGFDNAFSDTDAPATRTWHARKPLFGLDRVYLKNLSATSIRRLDGPPWSRLSDHLPVMAELTASA